MIGLLLSFFGCAGVLDLSRAEPLAPGEARFQVGSSLGLSGLNQGLGARVAASAHGGVTPMVELGGGLGATVVPGAMVPDASFDTKLRLGRNARGPFHAALNPRIRGTLINERAGVVEGQLPLLLGWDLRASQFVLAPRVGVLFKTDEVPPNPEAGLDMGWFVPLTEDLELAPAIGVTWIGGPPEAGQVLGEGVWSVAAGASFVVRLE